MFGDWLKLNSMFFANSNARINADDKKNGVRKISPAKLVFQIQITEKSNLITK